MTVTALPPGRGLPAHTVPPRPLERRELPLAHQNHSDPSSRNPLTNTPHSTHALTHVARTQSVGSTVDGPNQEEP